MLARDTDLLAFLTARRAAGPLGALRRAPGLRLVTDGDDALAWLERRLAVTQGVATVTFTLSLTWGAAGQGRIIASWVVLRFWIRGPSPLCAHGTPSAASPHIRSLPRAAAPQSPMLGVLGSGESGTILVSGVSQPGKVAVHSPGSSEAGQASWMGRGWLVRRSRQAALIVAPSGTTPSVTNRHKAMRSFLASATIETRRTRPRSDLTRSRNQRLSAVSGWWRSQSQASSIAVVRSLGLPDFEMPCSPFTVPLCHGLGARPA